MLKSITLENFFSFGEKTTIDLNPGVNILVGINGSGKSNFIKALRFLYLASQDNDLLRKHFIQEWGGFSAVANFNKTKKESIQIIYEVPETKNLSNKLEYSISKGSSTDIEKKLTILEYLYDKNSDKTKNKDIFFRKLLRKKIQEQLRIYDYNFLDSVIRQAQPNLIEDYLLPNGENLTALLNRIKLNHSLEYEKIEEAIRKINPHFKEIGFDMYGSRIYMVLREKNLARTVPLEHISDGTLRFLLLLAIFHNPNRGKLICIDEPEMGLHPDMIFSAAEMIKHAAKSSQVIVATHSPLLLNHFDLDDILVFEKNQDNETTVSTKTEEDFPDWNETFLTGQLWLQGELGGKRW